ncbi:hypothetical protein MHYP_G00038070 [Metynnis hypsauchen]
MWPWLLPPATRCLGQAGGRPPQCRLPALTETTRSESRLGQKSDLCHFNPVTRTQPESERKRASKGVKHPSASCTHGTEGIDYPTGRLACECADARSGTGCVLEKRRPASKPNLRGQAWPSLAQRTLIKMLWL